MGKTMAYYENVGDRLNRAQAERAYRHAQNAIDYSVPGYMEHVKRLQGKIIKAASNE